MKHLIICREVPPAAYPPGGIGTYVRHISRLLAEAGETVHVIGQRWDGAPAAVSESCNGRLIVHRVLLDEPVKAIAGQADDEPALLRRLAASDCPSQLFSWQAARLAESLIGSEGIDLIEGQEWEAPLYYLQVRRALGLGPRKEPPCLVHLHSPTQLIFRHNQWDETLADFLPLTRFEDYSVRAADGLVCPSRYLADGAAELFGLGPRDVQVIPYPMGDTAIIERTREVWESNSMCYLGRLELRKGVVEWVDAAVRVAASHPTVSFEFVGSDTSMSGGRGEFVRENLERRIPGHLRARFRFHGSRPRATLLSLLAKSPVVVVPSRWENLPYTCIEAMSTGAPVLASPNGGMVELIEDGRSGWIAPAATVTGLETALRRVLETPAAQRAEMGKAAALAVRRACANEVVIGRHLELRSRLASASALKSRRVPGFSPIGHADGEERRGMGFVIVHHSNPSTACIESLGKQTRRMQQVLIVAQERDRQSVEAARTAWPDGVQVLYAPHNSMGVARIAGLRALLAHSPELRSIGFANADDRLDPTFAELCEELFEHNPGAGLISGTSDDCMQSGAIRIEAYAGVCSTTNGARIDEIFSNAFSLASLLAESGWGVVTFPGLLSSMQPSKGEKRYSLMAQAQSGTNGFGLSLFLALPAREKLIWLRRALAEPGVAGRKVAWHARQSLKIGRETTKRETSK